MLDDNVPTDEATNMLWRRETGNIGTGRKYPANRTARAVRVKPLKLFAGIDVVLHTDFYARGKIHTPEPRRLASRAIKSVALAPSGKDGITYLINVKKAGITTPLMESYEHQILRNVGASSLNSALKRLKHESPEPAH